MTLTALLLAGLGTTGCATTGTTTGAPTRWPGAATCTIDPTLVGTWTDLRMTQLGPAWTRLSLACDCRYAVRTWVLFVWIDERGDYRLADGVLHLARPRTTTRWSYRVDGDQLRLTEAPGEVHAYARRGGPRACGG